MKIVWIVVVVALVVIFLIVVIGVLIKSHEGGKASIPAKAQIIQDYLNGEPIKDAWWLYLSIAQRYVWYKDVALQLNKDHQELVAEMSPKNCIIQYATPTSRQ